MFKCFKVRLFVLLLGTALTKVMLVAKSTLASLGYKE